jgi:hypothetical protein
MRGSIDLQKYGFQIALQGLTIVSKPWETESLALFNPA